MKKNLADFFFDTSMEEWRLLNFYQRFEQIVAVTVTIVISIVVTFALFGLIKEVFVGLVLSGFDPLEHRTFKTIFGMIMTVLIAMEFKHSIIKVAARKESIIKVKTVVMIALMALTRKMIILDLDKIQPPTLIALAVAIIALGAVLWFLREPEPALEKRHQSRNSFGRVMPVKRPFPGPRSFQEPSTSKRASAAVGSNFRAPPEAGPDNNCSKSVNPGLCPTSNTLRAVSGHARSTASKSETSAS